MGWIDWVFPARCAGCGRADPAGLCAGCLAWAPRAPASSPPTGLDAWYAAFAYEGPIREAVARIKYRNARAPVGVLVAALDRVVPRPLAVDCVTWVPASPERRRARGFDHAEVLARRFARRRGIPVRRLLDRRDPTPQTGSDRVGRLAGPALTARGTPPRSVLVIDDVSTTGATLRNAAAGLRAKGCERVIGATVARTLLKSPPPVSEKPHERGATPTAPRSQEQQMQNGARGGRQLLISPIDPDRRDRATYVARIGAQVRAGTYEPPLDGVVESLVTALLPHMRSR